MNLNTPTGLPKKQGLYDPAYEHDSCGIGFVAHVKGERSNEIIQRGLEALERMGHRGAESADNKTGDGAGILLQIPHDYYQELIPTLPQPGAYGTGIVFVPQLPNEADHCLQALTQVIQDEHLECLAWRKIEVDNSSIGRIAKASEPGMWQVFITDPTGLSGDALERKLLVVRKQIENQIRASGLKQAHLFYVASLSTKTIVYKGMLMSMQLRGYFGDLQDRRMTSAIAMIHSRFSTNTFPSWDLAQPFRMLAHNGEINTIKGNRFWMQTASASFETPLFGDDIRKILPVIEPGKSDSASLDNALEMLVATGRSLPHALMMLVPESFNKFNPIPDALKYFYEYHSAFMEPWDGPASLVFCDGRLVGGTLDRNGLRPSRYVVTKDGLIVMASEVGVQTFDPDRIEAKGRLRPGKLLLVDTQEGRIIPDAEMKARISTQKPYREWVETYRVRMDDIPIKRKQTVYLPDTQLHELETLYGYTREDLERIMLPMVVTGEEPIGSMGNDTPIAVFSDRPQPLFNYFKQVFAQVTNPAIDSYREEMVMTLTNYIGSEGNILSEEPENCRMIQFKRPIFTNNEIAKLVDWENPHFRTITLNMTFPVRVGEAGIEQALDQLCLDAENAIDSGYTIVILTDKGANRDHAPIPSLLACAGVHHHLVRVQKRTKVALIIQTGEAREVMHYALLFGYGASVIQPYGAFAVIHGLFEAGKLPPTIKDYRKAENNYIHAIDKGVLKVLSKLGISTLRSYHGAQTFEAIGLSQTMVDKYFTGTDSRIDGIGLREIAREKLMLHHRAFVEKPELLDVGGNYQWRKDGEKHAWNPDSIHLLQHAVRTNDYAKYRKFSSLVDAQNQRPHVIRGLFEFVPRTPVPLEDVEPAEAIFKRLTTGAMSFGSISQRAHETIAIAMNAIGGRSNSGEGGEDPERFLTRPDGSSARSKIKQIASARFGVTSNYLVNADELQIKVAQGAKPGEGGQLPGAKVDKHIARTRHSTPGVTLISPPPHHDIYSIEDLAQLIFDLKNGNPEARISVKLVSESGVGTVAAGVAKAHADLIIICGYDGGTGASPQSSIKHAGLPFELGLSETHQTLVMNGLRGRVRLQTDGQLKTGRDVVLAGILGAEEFAFGTGTLITLGCIMMRKCHLNTCPVGVATHDPELTRRFTGEPEHLIRYFTFLVQEIREIMAQLGIRTFNELIGRTDLLVQRSTDHWKAQRVDLSAILYRPAEAETSPTYCVEEQIHKIDQVLDCKLIQWADSALNQGKPIKIDLPIGNADRAVGAMLSSKISRRYGELGLPDNSIEVTFTGSAGQSFGAFLAKGVTFRLVGDSNDYLGKSLSGGRVIVVPPPKSTFKADENIIIGNTVLYGATSGEVYVRGVAGERFCVRNSGAYAVVEGAGDHCAEYMTGGRLVVLGKVGRNFAAGMSGGIAYVLNADGNFAYFCNTQMVELTPVFEPEDQEFLHEMVGRHLAYTGSTVAQQVLSQWHEYLPRFIKVMPLEYKRVLEEQKLEELNRKLAYIREEAELEEEF